LYGNGKHHTEKYRREDVTKCMLCNRWNV